MLENNINTSYESVFFIVPSYILKLPGLTLGFLKVYETIFQFWNKNLPCFLSEEIICSRIDLGRSQVYEALNFFEKHNQLKRIRKNGKRYLIQPERLIETDCIENIPTSAPADCNVRPSGHATSAPADHNIKNRNKEINMCGETEKIPIKEHTQVTLKTPKEEYEDKTFNNEDLKNLFKKKFAGRNITYEELFDSCCAYYGQRNNWVSFSKWKTWIENEHLDNYEKKGSQVNNLLTEEQKRERDEQFAYHEYKKRIECDKKLNLPSGNKEILDFDQWKMTHEDQR